MSSTLQRSSKSGGRQSLFYRDLASPISGHRSGSGRFATPGQAAAVSALWRENFGAASADPPPPPVFTLDDRADFSPEPGLAEAPPSSPSLSESRTPGTPPRRMASFSSSLPLKARAEESGSANGGQQLQQTPPAGLSWWSPVMRTGGSGGADRDEKGKGSPVDGVVQPGALITLPPQREVARPELLRNSLPTGGGLEDEEWVTVYGFCPGDTNLVLREFEKCGVILKHVPGPRDANWMHILYQNRYDAQKALRKNGMQINSVLIIGAKPVDPAQLQFLNERLKSNVHGGFMVSKASAGRSSAAKNAVGVSPRTNYLFTNTATTATDKGRRSTRAIASPAKSVVSKVMDLMFGI